MSLSLGQSKKVQDIQKKLDMSLDDLIKTKRVAPKTGSAGAGAKGKKAPKTLVATRPATAKRNAQATGIAAKKLDMKAKRAAGAALKGITGRRAPLGVATRGVGKGSTAKATGTVVKRSGGVPTTLAKRIVSRARATVKQQPQLRGKQVPKSVPAKKAKAKIPAPKFLGNAGTAQKQQQAPRQAQRKQAASAAGRIGQQRQQQQLQQGRRAPKTLSHQALTQQRQNGRNLNQTVSGGVRKTAKQQVPKFQDRIATQQQQGARQQRRGQQARAPVYVQQPAQQQQGSRAQRRQQQQQFQQFAQQTQGGRGGRNRAPLSVGQQGAHAFAAPAHPGLPALPMSFPMGFYNPSTGQYAAPPPQYAAAAQQASSIPTGQMYMDTNTGNQYWVPASEKNPSAYVARLLRGEASNAWAATQTALRSVKQQRPAIARRGRS